MEEITQTPDTRILPSPETAEIGDMVDFRAIPGPLLVTAATTDSGLFVMADLYDGQRDPETGEFPNGTPVCKTWKRVG